MKVLLISHNPISTQSNMGKTFLSLFSRFDRQELCQLYIYPVIPNALRCASYYRITDKEALNAVFRRNKAGAEIPRDQISDRQGMYEHQEDQSFYKSRKNKSAVRRLLRDAMWAVSPWNNRQLRAWLDREAPECIFVAPGVAKFLYNFALKIAKMRNIPIVTYICDEYYFVREPESLIDRLRLKLLRKKMEQLIGKTSHLVVISEEMRAEYARHFSVETTTLMTGAAVPAAQSPECNPEPKNLCYFGNIRCNRYVPLGEIGRTLDDINRERGTAYRLKIYTAEKDPQILELFKDLQSVELCGFVTGGAFEEALGQADLLLHTEAFDEQSMDFTQHSISTKIADSLASGIPLVAYGPENISSMGHLLRHECDITATSAHQLRETLLRAFCDADAGRTAAEKGIAVAKQFHDSTETSSRLREIVEQVIDRQ
jgi:hypothetical protein